MTYYKTPNTNDNESTAGADGGADGGAGGGAKKLHNIKLLIASFYTHIDYNYHENIFYFSACRIQNHRETQRVGNDRP